MQGDFTRNTHNPDKNFLRVLMQQGRVQLDADWNEQVSILLDYMQTLATDLIGPYGGPIDNCGFEILPATGGSPTVDTKFDFLIGGGHYYVYGKLCQNKKSELYSKQSYAPSSLTEGEYLVYLDVWERHITYIEDENELTPGIREVALGKADTTTRSQLIWQVKTISIDADENRRIIEGLKPINNSEFFRTFLRGKEILKPGIGLLKARAKKTTGEDASKPCIISPDSRYRRAENQLYRVEIHTPGAAGTATFKWSRENASVIFPVQDVNDATITLGHLGWDDRASLKQHDWVELVDDQYELQGSAKSLRQVDSINSMEMTVKLKAAFDHSIDKKSHPILRRWDRPANSKVKLDDIGTIIVKEDEWIELEEGVEISFAKIDNDPKFYATGDYWLIPARTATGDVEWPQETAGGNSPVAVPPHGIEHHYAPLSILSINSEGTVDVTPDFRRKFPNLGE
jgi:Family of unknown function (DUF6519)